MDAHPVECNGMGGRAYRNGRQHGEIFDHHFVEYAYGDGTMMYSQCRQIPGCFNSISEYAHGLKGTAEIHKGVIKGSDGEWQFRGEKENPYQPNTTTCSPPSQRQTVHEAEYGALAR